VVGSSYVFCYTAVALKPTALLLQSLEPVPVGQPVAPLELDRQLTGRLRLLGAQGLTGIALAAIDMAAWDALARAHDLPLGRLLGAEPRQVRMYGSVGYDGPDGSAREAAAWAERGVTGVKAKIGYPDVREDRAVIRAIRRATGDEMAVMVDYNQSLTPVEAIERARQLDDEGLTWIEEPTRAEDYAGDHPGHRPGGAGLDRGLHVPAAAGPLDPVRAAAGVLLVEDRERVLDPHSARCMISSGTGPRVG
jgi:mandelate racemase